jgi:carbon starvation protein CstA
VVLLVLVTAVFVVSPSLLLTELTSGKVAAWIWMIIILVYYLLSAIFPIDKIIGKAYPVFGIILVAMALAMIGGVIFQQGKYPMLELIGNLKDYSAIHGDLPWWPFMFTTVACGAVSGFHATQSPVIAKCIKSEKDGRQVFYGAMVAEGIIALIWAAAAMAFFRTNTLDGYNSLIELGGGNSVSVKHMSEVILGPVGTVLAIVGVIICPITSGDTALRSCRLIIAEMFKFDQKKIKNRLLITLPIFAVVIGLSFWNFADNANFNILWHWFAWSNQVIAAFALWIITIYLLKEGKYKWGSLISALPAAFMTAVTVTYILGEPNISLGHFIPLHIAYIAGATISLIGFVLYLISLLRVVRRD